MTEPQTPIVAKSCLIIDDQEVMRRVMSHMLKTFGIFAREALDAAEAIAECGRAAPDAILLDWALPDLDGMDCLQLLRGMPGLSKARIIYCMSVNSVRLSALARAAGANEVIVKPFDREMLRQKLLSVGVI
jgi:two-component system, chemotaxis family, chemotaxis protein CheY